MIVSLFCFKLRVQRLRRSPLPAGRGNDHAVYLVVSDLEVEHDTDGQGRFESLIDRFRYIRGRSDLQAILEFQGQIEVGVLITGLTAPGRTEQVQGRGVNSG